jgi:hypothetical protein
VIRVGVYGLVLLLGLPKLASSQTSDAQATSSMIIALEYAWNQAAMQKNSKALAALIDDSVVLIDPLGRSFDKAGYVAVATEANLRPQLQVTESMTVVVYDHSAIFRSIFRNSGVDNGKPYAFRARDVDIWVERNGSWVCVASQTTPITP